MLIRNSLLLLLSITFANADDPLFRSEKVKFIYDKALHHINNQKRLKSLESELSSYDNLYMRTKDLYAEGKISSLNKALKEVDDKLIDLLEKYDLHRTVQAFREKMKNRYEADSNVSQMEVPTKPFDDPRLEKLWQQAKDGKFSVIELIELYGELKDVEKKTKIYDDLLTDFNKTPDDDNSVHHDKVISLDEKNKKLKEAHRNMSEHLEEVHRTVTKSNLFSDAKVQRLWKLAQTGNFSTHELDVLKEELSHFDTQLRKVAFHKTELDAIQESRDKAGKSTLQAVEDVELEAKHERLERKVRKLEKYLESKVKHSEL